MSRPRSLGRILLTRDPERAGAWLERLAAAGFDADARSPTQQRPLPGSSAFLKRLLRPPRFTWTVLTSSVAARFVLERIGELAPEDQARARAAVGRVAAVGAGTAAPLEAAGISVDLIPARARASALMESLAPRLDPPRDRVLWARGAQALPTVGQALDRLGIAWEGWDLYETVASPEADALVEDLVQGRYSAVVFSAPSALQALLETAGPRRGALETALRGMRRVAWGSATAGALRRLGLPAHAEAQAPHPEAVVRSVAEVLD